MAGTKETAGKKKEKLFHPLSRKAGQLERKQLRSAKLRIADSKRNHKVAISVDRHSFFVHSLPPEVECLSLPELHEIVQRVWLARHDTDIESERATRRKGRPPSAKEVNLVKIKESECEEYRTGLEVLDLTDAANVTLIRRWKQDDRAYLDILRYVRISSQDPLRLVVSRPGKHQNLQHPAGTTITSPIAAELVIENFKRSSTIQGMDMIP